MEKNAVGKNAAIGLKTKALVRAAASLLNDDRARHILATFLAMEFAVISVLARFIKLVFELVSLLERLGFERAVVGHNRVPAAVVYPLHRSAWSYGQYLGLELETADLDRGLLDRRVCPGGPVLSCSGSCCGRYDNAERCQYQKYRR